MGVVLVGELNPYGADPRMALHDLPDAASGARLRRILGLSRPRYRALTRYNLCEGQWDLEEARGQAQVILHDHRGDVLVLLGRKVASAFRHRHARLLSIVDEVGHAPWVILPHPSGLNRLWNDGETERRTIALLREVAPEVPWLEQTED